MSHPFLQLADIRSYPLSFDWNHRCAGKIDPGWCELEEATLLRLPKAIHESLPADCGGVVHQFQLANRDQHNPLSTVESG